MNKKSGFTLIELLIVLVIIGIIVGLILPNTLRAINVANIRECTSNIRAINTAMQLCYTTTRDWDKCDTTGELIVPDAAGKAYLDYVPVCPFDVAYTPKGDNKGFEIDSSEHFLNWPPKPGQAHK